MFIKSLLASKNFSPSEAAKEAGYKYPAQAGNSLMKNEVIRASIGKELRERKERLEWERVYKVQEIKLTNFVNRLTLPQNITEKILPTGNFRECKIIQPCLFLPR